eukprot:g8724.t1 g8724   contig33:76630-77940(+)
MSMKTASTVLIAACVGVATSYLSLSSSHQAGAKMLMSAQQLTRGNAIDDTSIVGDVSALPYHGNMTLASISPCEQHFGYEMSAFRWKPLSDYYPPKEKEICLVHVGKSAGYAIACALGWDSPGCKRNNDTRYDDLLLPKYTTKWFHAGLYDCFEDSAYYMFIVRNPLDRAISAFNYEKPLDNDWERMKRKHGKEYYHYRKELYLDCFDTIEQLAQDGLAKQNGKDRTLCEHRAETAIDGSGRFGNQLFFNFQWHLEAVPKGARIMTIRTEHLVEDWNSAEYIVGDGKNKEALGKNQTVIPHTNVNTYTAEKNKEVSDESSVLLCERLCNEIQVYKHILKVSINLSEDQVQQSIDELAVSCPIEAESTSCNTPLPDITDKLFAKRGYDEGARLDSFTGEIVVGRSHM